MTDPAFHHSVGPCTPSSGGRGGGGQFGSVGSGCGISPDDKYFVDVFQTHDVPPSTQLVDAATGNVVARLAESDLTRFDELGLRKTEMFTYKAADGKTTLHGTIQFPSTFDASKKYPALVSVYGGPA